MAERLLAPGGCLVGPFDGEFLRLTRNRNVRRDTFNTPPPFVSDEFEEETLYQVAFAPLLRPTEREKPVVVAPRGPEPEEPEELEPLPEPKPVTYTVTSFGSEHEPEAEPEVEPQPKLEAESKTALEPEPEAGPEPPEPEQEPEPEAPSPAIPEAIPDA